MDPSSFFRALSVISGIECDLRVGEVETEFPSSLISQANLIVGEPHFLVKDPVPEE